MKRIYNLVLIICCAFVIGCSESEIRNTIFDLSTTDYQQPETVYLDDFGFFVHILEISIGNYCDVFPEHREVLVDRLIRINGKWWTPRSIDKQPVLLTYNESIEYAKMLNMQIPTVEQWANAARGNNKIGDADFVDKVGPLCPLYTAELHRVNTGDMYGNGYGIYNMIGNAQEWVIDADGNYQLMGIPHNHACNGDIDYDTLLKPSRSVIGENTIAGLRLVKNISK